MFFHKGKLFLGQTDSVFVFFHILLLISSCFFTAERREKGRFLLNRPFLGSDPVTG